MQAVESLSLAHLPIQDPAFAKDPEPFLAAARRQHPWLANTDFGYFLLEHQAIKDIMIQDDKVNFGMDVMIDHMGARGTPWGKFMADMMIAKTGRGQERLDHKRLRDSIAAAFTPKAVKKHIGLMRKEIAGLLDDWAPKGAFDFAEFAANFPIRVMCGLIGASTDAVPGIRKALETQGLSFSMDPSLMPALEEGFELLYKFVDDLVVEREREGIGAHEDLLDAMIEAKTSGQLNDREMRELLIFLFAAGYDTSKNMLTLIMWQMLTHQDYWKRCATDLDFCDKVMEEGLRHTSPSSPVRLVAEEITYRDVAFPAGAAIICPLSVSGRDPSVFEDHMEFDPERKNATHHLAFGRGMHICLGQYLARLQIQEGLHQIAQRVTNPRLDGEIVWRPFPGVWGIWSLPIKFGPT